MRKTTMLSLIVMLALALAGCVWEVPLETAHEIAIDPALPGLWEPVPREGEEAKETERMLILRFSDTEYVVHHPMGSDDGYWRAYPIRVAGVACVQVELLGDAKGPLDADEEDRFAVVSYELDGDELTMRTLNQELVDDGLKTTEELRAAFSKHKDHPDLFRKPLRFRRR